jgi:hypothetical protein
MALGARSALLSGPIVAAIAAIAIIELGVLSIAVFGGDADPCARPRILRSASMDSTCAAKPREIKYDDQLYGAVVDTVYHPARYSSTTVPNGVLLLNRTPVTGLAHLDDSSVLAGIRTSLPPGTADDLIADFRRANGAPHEHSPLYRWQQFDLDTASVRRMMSASDADVVKQPLVSDLLAGNPPDSLPPVLALSLAGVDTSGKLAMVYAAMYDRHAHTPDHLEAAAFILARRDGARWIVTREIPISLARRP